ncbi:hypothetical protein FGO68_gene5172 [Halteria grandinella]|uniref:Uncharacterized protein n=1 Tax=Halteria grandinella TaxID=5974 RepID=A0A8J8P6L9_HALGN|nr:hypothetical protein FGO68_gene5172 [Halteria grandinella]
MPDEAIIRPIIRNIFIFPNQQRPLKMHIFQCVVPHNKEQLYECNCECSQQLKYNHQVPGEPIQVNPEHIAGHHPFSLKHINLYHGQLQNKGGHYLGDQYSQRAREDVVAAVIAFVCFVIGPPQHLQEDQKHDEGLEDGLHGDEDGYKRDQCERADGCEVPVEVRMKQLPG